jgi:hypothetical protein
MWLVGRAVGIAAGAFLFTCTNAFAGIDADTAIHGPDQFNWELFSAINKPAGDGTNASIWETWAEDPDTFPQSPDPAKPPVWSWPGREHALVPASKPDDEVRRNKAAFDYIVKNGLWYREGIARFFSSGADVSFPPDSIEVKASWKTITEADKPRYRWNVDSKGALYGLIALHLISKVVPNWTWATFEHVDNTGRCDVIGCDDSFGAKQPTIVANPILGQTYHPCETTEALLALFSADGLDQKVWRNYCLKGSQSEFRTAKGLDTRLGNSQFEGPILATSSCMTCHSRAFYGAHNANPYGRGLKSKKVGYIGPPRPEWFYTTLKNARVHKGMQTGFVWAIPFCSSSISKPNNNCY